MTETLDESTVTPNCPRCLTRMVLAGLDEHPYWLCDDCGFARLS